uniref:Veg16 n=1 Tax=uncultured soil bacterium TaxID=164851 RepID=B7T188_9BACT|nr:VEG16 [uncultured soil bacterium]
MRVLLSTSGSRGDVEPLLALAVQLQELGVQVRMCAPADSAERCAEVGVPLVPVGPKERVMLKEGMPPPSPEEGRRFAAEAIALQFDQVRAAAEGCDAVVATGELAAAIAVRSVAEKLDIPYVYSACSQPYLPSSHYPPPLDEETEPGTDNRTLWDQRSQRFCEGFGEMVNDQRVAIGLPPVENVFAYGHGDQPWLATDPVLAPLQPNDFGAVQTGVWILPDSRPLSDELEAFLAAGSPPVYVGFGSSAGLGTDDAALAAIEAVRAKGRRVILSRGWAELDLPDDRDDLFAVDEVNLQALFGRVAVAIHHGSAGTVHIATRAGVPQIVIPQSGDQPHFAERVAELGIGAAHDVSIPTFESLSAALDIALAPEVHTRATAVAGQIRTDGAAVAAELLLVRATTLLTTST